MSPFVHQSNSVLFFASDEHLGMGGFDLFSSKIENGKFQEAINLGYPLNTAKDENSLTLSAQGDFAIYSSDLDLYSFTMPEEIRPLAASYIKGKVLDKQTNKPLSARLQIKNLSNGRLAHESFSDKETGDFLICLAQGEEYILYSSFNIPKSHAKTDGDRIISMIFYLVVFRITLYMIRILILLSFR